MRYKTTNVLQLANTVLQRVQKEKLFNSQHNLLIMFSGGQDSAFCLLVLFLLKKKTRFTWNRTKLLNLLKQHKIEKTITKQIQRSCFYNRFGTTFIPVTLFEQEKVAYTNLINEVENKYTLLWCNHFWQKDSFFTMEHVSKLTFCKNYTICFFVPIKKIVSEQSARNWRHKVMQRSSFFLRQKKSCYKHVELYLNLVFIAVLRAPKTKQIFVSGQHVQRNRTLDIQVWPEQLCVQGHNKSDRAEAILFNLIKGTGMNGISTLQWKHTFFSSSNANHMFYPVFFDFFKEIRIVCLNSLFSKSCKQKRAVRTDKAFLGITMFWHNGVKFNKLLDLNKLEHRIFPKDTYVKSLYYQLKYKTKKI